MDAAVAILIPLVCLAFGAWCGMRIERDRRDRELDRLLGEEQTNPTPSK